MNFENNHSFEIMEKEVKHFGKIFIEYAWNRTMDNIKMIIDGKSTTPTDIKLRDDLESFSLDQKNTLVKYIRRTLISCMFNIMIMVNERGDINDDIHLLVNCGDGEKEIKDLSDGLEGDLFDWLNCYAQDDYDNELN
ncbi:MAG: hypothetical protein NC253_02785 [Ruminococcus sp.]|nr:hypothetical protein [Ruminococcus sp.]MCM1480790.1 hypothetical protein [Muribaculaceae bacterium]